MYANETTTKKSFSKVKEHILDLQSQIYELKREQNRLMKEVNQSKNCPTDTLVGALNGPKVHIESCPFAKNIHPKNKVTFVSKEDALNKGYRPCECMKKV